MIPRYQKIIFIVLLIATLGMAITLWQLRDRAHKRLLAGETTAPTRAPEVAPAEQVTLMVASDSDGSLVAQARSLPLPADPGARARVLLNDLLELYTAPDAAHSVPAAASGVAQVFLLPATGPKDPQVPDAQMAVVNLTGNFANSHPSGLETETLTISSFCATLHANFPNITQVRFLVDGQPRATLAGHADLTRTYLTADAVPAQPITSASSPAANQGTNP